MTCKYEHEHRLSGREANTCSRCGAKLCSHAKKSGPGCMRLAGHSGDHSNPHTGRHVNEPIMWTDAEGVYL